jgi:hypothetical protein
MKRHEHHQAARRPPGGVATVKRNHGTLPMTVCVGPDRRFRPQGHGSAARSAGLGHFQRALVETRRTRRRSAPRRSRSLDCTALSVVGSTAAPSRPGPPSIFCAGGVVRLGAQLAVHRRYSPVSRYLMTLLVLARLVVGPVPRKKLLADAERRRRRRRRSPSWTSSSGDLAFAPVALMAVPYCCSTSVHLDAGLGQVCAAIAAARTFGSAAAPRSPGPASRRWGSPASASSCLGAWPGRT